MFETLTIIFWSITYLLIIVAGFKSTKIKKVSMPYIPGILDVAWEICATVKTGGYWGNIAWLSLDLLIVYFGFRYAKSAKQRIIYGLSIAISIIALYFISQHPDGLLFSVFIIDLIIAVWYLIDFKKLSPVFIIPIAITKLLGDVFAAFACAATSWVVPAMAIPVFICNLLYLCLCLEVKSKGQKKLRKR